MVVASDLNRPRPGLFTWQAYDPEAKADLFSTALATRTGFFVIDPIQLDEASLAKLTSVGPIRGIILTNANHLRSAETYVTGFSAPVYAHREAVSNVALISVNEVTEGTLIGDELQSITIEGAAPGEIAVYHAGDGGTLVVGDTLINFDPYGFTFLPDKYCEDPTQMRQSLRKLLRYNTERILFAHGLPILTRAHGRLRQLLEGNL
jgi:glyoxylase-like metal-dependent hydrolase (beta-lactamase superfamily II)